MAGEVGGVGAGVFEGGAVGYLFGRGRGRWGCIFGEWSGGDVGGGGGGGWGAESDGGGGEVRGQWLGGSGQLAVVSGQKE